VEIEDYRLRNLRRHVSQVTQHVTLFNDTVANNIAYGDLAGAPRADIEAAAADAYAKEFVDQLPRASIPKSARTAYCCPAASASAWRLPGRC
jgi:subfamily B ATP-binding cassette protein MsbA